MKTKQQVAAEIKALLEENGYRLKQRTNYYAPCDNCYDEVIYVGEGWGHDSKEDTIDTTVGTL